MLNAVRLQIFPILAFCYQKVARIDYVASLLQPLGKATRNSPYFPPFGFQRSPVYHSPPPKEHLSPHLK